MNEFDVGYYLGRGILLVLLLSLPTVGATALVGLLVGLFQGLTQIQDQTISFALRLVAAVLTLLWTSRWIGQELTAFAHEVFEMMARL